MLTVVCVNLFCSLLKTPEWSMIYYWLTAMKLNEWWFTIDWLLWNLMSDDLLLIDCYETESVMIYYWLTVMNMNKRWFTIDWLLWNLMSDDLLLIDCYEHE